MNRFASGMAEIVLTRTMLSREVILVYNVVTRDHYQDPVTVEEGRYKKLAMIKKTMDMQYVQELLGPEFLEDSLDQIPWLVNLTYEFLPRIPRMDDQILIEGILYSISAVKPMNRDLESLITLFIYPERKSQIDKLAIYTPTFWKDGEQVTPSDYVGSTLLLDFIYGGNPQEMSFDNVNWRPFQSRINVTYQSGLTLYLKDTNATVVSKEL